MVRYLMLPLLRWPQLIRISDSRQPLLLSRPNAGISDIAILCGTLSSGTDAVQIHSILLERPRK